MKLLDLMSLEDLSAQLCNASKRFNIDARLESYSCKMVSEEKRELKELVQRLRDEKLIPYIDVLTVDDSLHCTKLNAAQDKCTYLDVPCLNLSQSQTIRKLRELTGHTIDPSLYRRTSQQSSVCESPDVVVEISKSPNYSTDRKASKPITGKHKIYQPRANPISLPIASKPNIDRVPDSTEHDNDDVEILGIYPGVPWKIATESNNDQNLSDNDQVINRKRKRTVSEMNDTTGKIARNVSHNVTEHSKDDCILSLRRCKSPNEKSLLVPNVSDSPSISIRDLFCLMSTLNSCFSPIYNFLGARSNEFCLEPELWLIEHYISKLCSIYMDRYEELAPHLWSVIGREISPQSCTIYSYKPDQISDPYSSRCLASFNYFFHNKALKRLLFFSVRILNEPRVVNECYDSMVDLY